MKSTAGNPGTKSGNKHYHIKLTNSIILNIRQVCSSDRECLIDGFRRLSPQSKRFRFLSAISRLLPAQVTYFTDIDNKNHCAWGAQDIKKNFRGVGIARYIRIGETPSTAEFAITIVDDYQKKGIGTLLFCLLLRSALENGISVLIGYCHPENAAIHKMLTKFNPRFSYHQSNVRIDLDVRKIQTLSESLLSTFDL
jgi:RimJ/RimL family protein N-acetyltransferase